MSVGAGSTGRATFQDRQAGDHHRTRQPYLIERFPQAETWLAAFGISDVAQISAARALFGQIPVRGHVPVTIPSVNMKLGFGLELPENSMTLQPMDVRGELSCNPRSK